MADESGEKTEQPTDKKLRDARERGQVAISQEVSSTASILGAFFSIWLLWDHMVEVMEDFFNLSVEILRYPFQEAFIMGVNAAVYVIVILTAPILFLTMAGAALGVFIQIGFLVSFESVIPSFGKLNPKEYFKKVFSKKGFIELIKTFLKLGVLGTLLYLVIVENIDLLLEVPALGKDGIIYVLGELLRPLMLLTVSAFVAIAAIDFILQKQMHTKELMMSQDEIKREFKESEGNPEIKGQRKQLHQELVMSDTEDKVKKSNVLITNPTHLAIALYYKSGKTDLPVVYAIGENYLAIRMKEIAEANNIPIMRNVPLARGLYVDAKVNHYIPIEFIEPVAEVMRWVRQIEEEKYIY